MNKAGDNEELSLGEVSIERLKEVRVEEVVKLIHRTIRESWGGEYAGELIEAFCNKYDRESILKRMKDTTYWIAENSGGGIIGVIGLKGDQLRTFFVDPECQGRGVGRRLYVMLEREAGERGLDRLKLEGSPWGQKAYEAFGFEVQGVRVKKRELVWSMKMQ